jgi:zona occludens toxin
MMAVVTGPPGSGKSFYAVCKAIDAVESGKFLVTNFPLIENWEETVANHHPLRYMIPGRRRALAKRFRQRSFYSPDLTELSRLRFEGRAEGRAVAVIDEAHQALNARMWNDSDRAEHIRFFTQHRHVGLDLFLLTQDLQNIDRQVRALLEYHISLRNLRRMKVMGIPVSPINLFLAIWLWHSGPKNVVKRELFPLNWRKKLYDTHGYAPPPTDGAIWLPRSLEPDGGREPEHAA